MKIHALYSLPHYGEHLKAIFRHLPDDLKGQFTQTRYRLTSIAPEDLVMIAGVADIGLAQGRRIIFVEHGAGQRYLDLDRKVAPYYGGPYPDNVIAYLGPRQSCVDEVGLPGYAIGAPVCDPYDLVTEDGVCAITFHWKGRRVCPEADSALGHYADRLGDIVERLQANGWEVLGHRHPRLRAAQGLWKNLGVEEVDVTTVRNRASLLIADNTSLAYEMAYLFRRNITLNAPWYRREVDHGLRFWDNPPGLTVDGPDELMERIDSPGVMENLGLAGADTVAVYDRHHSDGLDGLRAATWLTTFAAGL